MGVVAGWYPDPEDAGRLRYWNGEAWTASYAPLPPLPAPPAPPPQLVPPAGVARAPRPAWARPAILVPAVGNALGLLLGVVAAGVPGLLAMAALGLLLGGLWHLLSGRGLPGVPLAGRPLGGALLGGSLVALVATGLVAPEASHPVRPAAASPSQAPSASPSPSRSATPSPSPSDTPDLEDPDNTPVAASLVLPAPAPTVDVAAVLADASGQTALATLTLLPVAEPAAPAPYDREAFGYRAVDADRNGCDTRNDVLRRDLTATTLKEGTQGCVVLTGSLRDPYSGAVVSFERGVQTSADVQVDHVVALGDAWQHGAATWTADRLQAFGNDPLNLLAVEGAMNQQKGEAAADGWLPPNVEFRCEYVARQVGVKHAYGLSVSPAEKAAMTGVLATCAGQDLPVGFTRPAPVVSANALAAQQAAQAAAAQAAADKAAADAAAAKAAAAPAAEPPADSGADLDPRYKTCKEAISHGYGPYTAGVDPEYNWYRDGDNDGVNCES